MKPTRFSSVDDQALRTVLFFEEEKKPMRERILRRKPTNPSRASFSTKRWSWGKWGSESRVRIYDGLRKGMATNCVDNWALQGAGAVGGSAANADSWRQLTSKRRMC